MHARMSSNMSELVSPWRMFNLKLNDFIADLKPIIGHLPEYSVLQASTKVMANLDEKTNQNFFNQYVAEAYAERIVASDESFFLKSSYDEFSNVGVVHLLKNAWTTLAETDKAAVWAHLQVLIVLNRRCLAAVGK